MELITGVVLGAIVGATVVALVVVRRSRGRLQSVQDRYDRTVERYEAKERSAEQRSNLQARILDAMEEGVLLVRSDGPPLFSNEALGRHLGSIPASADAIRPLQLATCVRDTFETGERRRTEVEIGSPSRSLLAVAAPVDDAVLLVIRDVTQARRLAAMRRDFVANASHELKTPVASIRAAAETLRAGAIDDPPAAHRFTDQLEREAIRLSHILADLLDLSRLETGGHGDDVVPLDRIVAEETARLEGSAHERGVLVRTSTGEVPAIKGSARDLGLLVGNLIDNAIRYTQPGGEVDVRVFAEDTVVVVRVQDTGVGIPQRDLPRIFERFYRVDQARSRETGGTGLGLAIVKHVAENHGGEVGVTSELGRGSTFEVRLPLSTGGNAP
jgi:signal transduction histidine kinase